MLTNKFIAKCPKCDEIQVLIRALREPSDTTSIAHVQTVCCKCHTALGSEHILWTEDKGANGEDGYQVNAQTSG